MSPSTAESILHQYQGQIVHQSYNGGFVALSYLVSLVGSASTLELINRRTGSKGLFNHLLLICSAVTMGGISIWCMHFIGNRAMDLANGEPEAQAGYSAGFTAISFFVPILVLLAAFVAIGVSASVSWWRVAIGGVLCGAAVCGMHYLGNYSIDNYDCVYEPTYVIGSAIISVVASNIALATFFVYRAMWVSSWWKRLISAIVLAGAASGMHWCAAVGTRFRLISLKPVENEPSRSATVIVVICLSLGACGIIAGSATVKARAMRRSALRAQQITLGAAIFDRSGRILVNSDGLLPSTVVTDSFLEKSSKEGFTISHRLFHWMFQASRNWSGIENLLDGMRNHLLQLPHNEGREGDERHGIKLVNEYGDTIEEYDLIFRELFCMAAVSLAERLRENITFMGVLWDQILPTGTAGKRTREEAQKQEQSNKYPDPRTTNEEAGNFDDVAEKGISHIWHKQEYGRGSLMFLVRRVKTDRDAERLTSAGYRFAELRQVSDIIRSGMQIQSPELESKLQEMASYANQQNRVLPGVNIGFFAVRALVNSRGFEVLVRKGARNLLPSTPLSINKLEAWHLDFLKQFSGMTASTVARKLVEFTLRTPREASFASQLVGTIQALRECVRDPLFEDSILTPRAITIPGQGEKSQKAAAMIAFRLVVPIHSVVSSPSCEFVPLGFLKMYHVAEQYQLAFVQGVHREFWFVNKNAEKGGGKLAPRGPKAWFSSKVWSARRAETESDVELDTKTMHDAADDERRLSSNGSTHSSSTVHLCQPASSGDDAHSIDVPDDKMMHVSRQNSHPAAPSYPPYPPYGSYGSYGGIMVSQEITINVEDAVYGMGSQLPPTRHQERSDSQDTMVVDGAAPAPARTELRGHVGTNVEAGGSSQRIHDDMMPTFVDILFAETVEGR